MSEARIDLDRIAHELAARQHGLVTRRQLLQAGASPRRIQLRVDGGRFRRLHRGVYLVGAVAPPRAAPMAACLACGPSAVVSHRSAAVLWKLIRASDRDNVVDVTTAGPNRRRVGVRVHRSRTLRASDRTYLEGVPITTPTRTLLDFAAVCAVGVLDRAVAEAFARALTTERQLATRLKARVGRPGSARLRAVLGGAPPPVTRSEAEERLLEIVRRTRMARPRVNSRIGPYEVDFYWPDAGLVVEVDGFASHHSRRAFERDRRRDADLVAKGLRVMRVTWRQLEDEPEALVFRLGQALAGASPIHERERR
ncbi:MAG: DUF559 domain-containing protein [Gemmatimonadetes bacterium]|nr:DUF559 domain-containing protein [Gemmatimonadota bacterium]